MSSYRKRTQSKPTTAAGLRAQASANGNSIFGNRQTSLAGLFGSKNNSYSTLLGINTPKSYSTPSFLNKTSKNNTPNSFFKNSYSDSTNNLNYSNPYTTYGGTSSGYGGLTVPSHSTVHSLNLATPISTYNYPQARWSVHRASSFNQGKSRPNSNSNFGSRSSSLQSLAASEGYISGNERSGRSSRLGSVSSVSSDTQNPPPTRTRTTTSENGELDYKKLYEESQAENERLKDKLRRSDEQLKEAKSLLDKAQTAQTKNSLSEAEKRERRAMERKLSEMEEELKMMEYMKCENQRLKDENGALIRVISKLSK